MTAFKRKTKPKVEVLPPADNTPPKQHLEPFKWKPGVSANPAGRPKGSRSKFAEVFLKDFLADWELNGAEVIARCREEDPATFLRVAASILPKELNIKEGESALETLLQQFGAEQLDEFIAGVLALGAAQKGTGPETKALTRSKSDGVH